MTVISRSPSHLDRACAITRTENFRDSQLQLAPPLQFRRALCRIGAFYATPRLPNSPVAALRGRFFDPSQPFAVLQSP
jgi:hypothetical protein